jgi:folate-binding protein YgfZ
MAVPSPIDHLHTRAQAFTQPYGPPLPPTPSAPERTITLVQTYGPLELEYAAVRKSAALVDLAHRATIEITGRDALAFLGRMITQELKGFAPMSVRRAFWLNRKGRIDADLRLLNLADRVLVDVDAHAAARTATGLSAYVITEDVAIVDATDRFHRLALHGPLARQVLARFIDPALPDATAQRDALLALEPNQVLRVTIAGASVLIDRADTAGEVGLELLVPTDAVERVYGVLLEAAHQPVDDVQRPNLRPSLRPIGWAAYNIARIEAGTPLYNVDFGPDALPGETGVLNDRVSFTKGCYLGQEVVARMHALGSPKRVVVALRLSDPALTQPSVARAQGDATADSAPPPVFARCPEAGSPVYSRESIDAWRAQANASTTPAAAAPEPVGAITSSTLAPMLAHAPIALASVKFKHATAGTELLVDCDNALLPAKVQGELRFVTRTV